MVWLGVDGRAMTSLLGARRGGLEVSLPETVSTRMDEAEGDDVPPWGEERDARYRRPRMDG